MTDDRDHCPRVAGPIENAGCPDVDSDGDGIVDRRDQCPEQYGPPRLRGCREADRDGDGIPDGKDRCPRRPEVWNGNRDGDGCPDKGRAVFVVLPERRLRLTGKLKVLPSGKLNLASRRALRVLGAGVRQMGLGRVRLHVVAEYGLSYGDSIQRARRVADVAKVELLKSSKLRPDTVEIVAEGPDGRPRVELSYP